ncbi:pseudouridylate synthase 1 homolog isoform X2 [Liolophura sinensis]
MADILPGSPEVPPVDKTSNAGHGKRELNEDGDGPHDGIKKQKTEPGPMQGRVDRKRKVAMLMAYSGVGYYGMQINPGFATIEDTLCKALVAAGVIPQEHAVNMQKMSFQRAARTDKGVSALGQLVSLKMTLNQENIVGAINEHLPDQIRVIGIKRATKGFNSKNHCSGRSYIYMLPTYAFAPVEKFIDEDYRVADGIIDRVNGVLQNFKGTHNFHNYTSGIKPNDPSAKRYMVSLECGQPFVRDNVEFAIIRIKGQSFMMHHIRKMIGVTIAIVRGFAGEELLVKAWGKEKVDIPKAPGLGLMLEQLHYDAYNKKFGSDGMHDPIEWTEFQSTIEEFAEKYIYSNIVKTEKEERSMFHWLMTLPNHSFDVREPGSTTDMYKAMRNVERLNESLQKQSEESPPEPTMEHTTDRSEASETLENSKGDNKQCHNTSTANTCISASNENGSHPDKNSKGTEEIDCDEMKNSNESKDCDEMKNSDESKDCEEIKDPESESNLERDQNRGVS